MTLIAAFAVAAADLAAAVSRRRRMPSSSVPSTAAASIVIPNWNGRDLLAKYLPSVIEASAGNSANEIIVVDNGSTDGSVEFVRENFPRVRVLALGENLGFGGGSNAGIHAARNDVAVLLNSDMRVEPGFLAPLLEAFTDEKVFAVSCQIFFSDPSKRREETGLAQGWWEHGGLRVGHREDPDIVTLFPCFYGGGGSCAFHREKFLELGGFDEIFQPFYLEDTDLGYMAWKRGWKVLYQPRSVVYHEHRGTIGKRFSDAYIQGVLKKNFLLFTWKNIHEWRKLGPHFLSTAGGVIFSAIFGDSADRPNLSGLWKAVRQLPGALSARRRARSLSLVSDTEAFRRPLGGYFRDRFEAPETDPETLRVLFFSPYPIYPPTHGGAVFMYQTVRELANLCELHLFILLEYESEYEPHRELDRIAASSLCILRPENKRKDIASLQPNSVREFRHRETEWLLHRQLYLNRVDVLQLEYTTLGQYAPAFDRMACVLFEHDVYFQSIARALPYIGGAMKRVKARYEYLRALRFELPMLRKVDRIQVCSGANAAYLLQFAPELKGKIDDDLRAGIDTASYSFQPDGREPDTMLFLGSFRHVPNQEGLQWFTREVLPRILEKRPRARLVVVGSEPPARHSLPFHEAIELRGFVEDVREPLNRYAVFVCPILSGSGMRVKLLEAFAAGIPVVSTSLGAEGLAGRDGELCALADKPEAFAEKVVELLMFREKAAELAVRARAEVETNKNMAVMTARLAESYRQVLRAKRKL
jgi:GT2 family glycosyltransferase/glycosyltransferase involved in cell wall biosynthesis